MCCRKTDIVYFLNPQHQINEQKIALILICRKELSYQDLYQIMIFFRAIVSEELYDKIQETATRAAISQVMARNTSHNIGAHVMNKLIGSIRELALFLFDDTKTNYKSTELKSLHPDVENKLVDNPWIKKVLATFDAEAQKVRDCDKRNKILEERQNFFDEALKNEINNYVKCRMDYLADISFGTPLMQTNKYAYEDLFKRLDEVRLLLEHISGLDSFKYKIEFTKNGEPLTTDKDLLVAIPNDILGTQAFYNILENIIRNTAKHSDKSNHNKDNPIVQ